MTSVYEQARRHEDNGDLLVASKYYAEEAFATLNDSNFEQYATFRVGISLFMSAISCDCRANNDRRAVWLRFITEASIEFLFDVYEFDDVAKRGLLQEWLGDVYLMTDPERAEQHYETAINSYNTTDGDSCYSLAMEEDFDYAMWAIQQYLSARGYGEFADSLPVFDFVDRVEEKQNLLQEFE